MLPVGMLHQVFTSEGSKHTSETSDAPHAHVVGGDNDQEQRESESLTLRLAQTKFQLRFVLSVTIVLPKASKGGVGVVDLQRTSLVEFKGASLRVEQTSGGGASEGGASEGATSGGGAASTGMVGYAQPKKAPDVRQEEAKGGVKQDTKRVGARGSMAIKKGKQGLKGREALLAWSKERVQPYPKVIVTNLTTSWLDGMAFCALLHRKNPSTIPHFAKLNPKNAEANLELAFGVAENVYSIERFVDVEYLVKKRDEGKRPDAKIMQMVIAEWFHRLQSPSVIAI